MSPVQKKNYGFVKRLLVWAGTAALIMSRRPHHEPCGRGVFIYPVL